MVLRDLDRHLRQAGRPWRDLVPVHGDTRQAVADGLVPRRLREDAGMARDGAAAGRALPRAAAEVDAAVAERRLHPLLAPRHAHASQSPDGALSLASNTTCRSVIARFNRAIQ